MANPVTDRLIPSKYHVKSEVCAVEFRMTESGTVLSWLTLKRSGKKLEISGTGDARELSQIPDKIFKNKVPVVVVITGKPVITKQVQSEKGQTAAEVFRNNFPAIRPEDFYVQYFAQENRSDLISLTRRDIVNDVVQAFEKSDCKIANLYLGPATVGGMAPFWGNFNQVPAGIYRVQLQNGLIENISQGEVSNENITIEGLEFPSTQTLSFAAGIAYLLQVSLAENLNQELNAYYENHISGNKVRVTMMAAVALAFIIAVGNLLYYTSLFNENKQLDTELTVFQGQYEQINKLLTEYQKNKSLIEGAGVLNKSRISEYADRLAATVPDEVTLQELHFNPVEEKENGEDSLTTFTENYLVIKGMCGKSLVVNDWVNVLKMQRFTKEVILERFAYNMQPGAPNFEMRLTIR